MALEEALHEAFVKGTDEAFAILTAAVGKSYLVTPCLPFSSALLKLQNCGVPFVIHSYMCLL